MKGRNYLKPTDRSIARVLREWAIGVVFAVLFAVGSAVFLIEWMAGCGETYIAADGKRYPYECVFITLHKE